MKVSNEQNILLKISQSIISTLDYQSVLQIISDGMSELLEIETAAIYLVEKENNIYLGATTPPLDPNMPQDLRNAKLSDHPHMQKAVFTHKPHVVPDTNSAELSPSEKMVVEFRNLRSLLFLPFIKENNILGVLILGTINKPRIFTKEEINLSQTVANQLSIGIQNSRLHYNLQKQNKKLAESEDIYRNLFDQAAEGIFLMAQDGKIVQSNKSFAQMHGYSVKEIHKMNIAHLDVRKEKTFSEKKIIDKKLQDGKVVQMEVEHYHKKGHIIPLLVSIKNIKLNNINYSLCFHQDLTIQKKIEKELKDHRNNLEELVKMKTMELDNVIEELTSINEELSNKNKIINKQNIELKKTLKKLKETQVRLIQTEKMASLGILTAGVAHEINNPLNYIMGSYSALETYFEEIECKDPELINKLMNRIKTGLDKATSIVRGLNQFSRENQNLDEFCDLHEIMDNCLIMLGNETKDRIDIIKKYSQVNISIKGNVGQIHQAFLNILTNAVQAIKNKGEIDISTSIIKDEISIEISDSGEGVTKENLTKITDPFFTTKEPGEGTGLGLSITYSIIKEHKGSIEFESVRNKGTKVKIKLPAIFAANIEN